MRLNAEYFAAFEISTFRVPVRCSQDWDVWVSFDEVYEFSSHKIRKQLIKLHKGPAAVAEVTVVGYLKSGQSFGHLGQYEAEFVVLAVEDIGPIRESW